MEVLFDMCIMHCYTLGVKLGVSESSGFKFWSLLSICPYNDENKFRDKWVEF